MLRRLMPYMKGYRKPAVIGPLLMVVEVACELILPLLMANIIDVGINGEAGLAYILTQGGLMIFLAAVSMFSGVMATKFASTASMGFGANLRKGMFDKIQEFSFADIDRFSSASLVTRMTNDVSALQMMVGMALRMLVRAPVMLIAALVVCVSINAKLARVLFVVIPLMAISIGVLMTFCHKLFGIMQKKIDNLNGTVQENLVAIRVVKAFVRAVHEKVKFKKSNDDEYEKYTEKWIEALFPLLSDNGSIYVCCDWESGMVIGNVLKKYFTVRNRITWQREKGRGALSNWKNGMEDIWFATKGDSYTFNVDAVKIRRKVLAPYKVDGKPKDWEETKDGNFRNTCPSNFWDDISIPYWSMPENTPHPTQKPEKLLAKLILASSNEGDMVFDPFLGSGSTSVTAKKLGRHFVGIEQSETYCAIAEKRLIMAETDKSIQGYTDGVFWERNTKAIQNKYKKLED